MIQSLGPPSSPDSPPGDGGSPLRRALPIYYALLFAILTVALLFLLVQLRHVLIILFISLLFAAAVARPAAYLERLRLPRAAAALIVYLAAIGVIAGIGWLVVPTLARQVAQLGNALPGYAERYNTLRETYEGVREQYPALPVFDDQVSRIGARLTDQVGWRLLSLPGTVFTLFLDLLAIFAISMLLITSRTKLLASVLGLTHPRHRVQTRRVLSQMWLRLGHYLRAKLIVMAIVGAITAGALALIGVPYSLLLGTVAGLGVAVPRIGPWLARIPIFAIAALEGWATLGLAFAACVIIDNLKGFVISPFIEGDQLDIHPLLVLVAVLVGASLLGFIGAFVAVPAAAMVQVVFEEVIIPWRRRQIGEAGGDGREPEAAGG